MTTFCSIDCHKEYILQTKIIDLFVFAIRRLDDHLYAYLFDTNPKYFNCVR